MHRRPSERTFLFGIHPVLEALNEGKPLQRVLFLKGKQTDEMSEILRQCREMEVPAQAVPKERLDRVTMKNHQGVVAFTSPIEFQPLDEVVLAALEQGQTPLMVALDGVTTCATWAPLRARPSASEPRDWWCHPRVPPPSTKTPSSPLPEPCSGFPCAVSNAWTRPPRSWRNLVSNWSRFLKRVPPPSTALNPPPQLALCLETNIQAFPLR